MPAHEWYGSNSMMRHCLWMILSVTLLFVSVVLIKLSSQIYVRLQREKVVSSSSSNASKESHLIRKLNRPITAFSICGLICYAIANIIFLIAEIRLDSYSWTGYPYPFICITWGSANIFAYLLYIFRLKVSFRHTAYRTSEQIVYLFYLLIFLFLCSQILETVLNIGEVYDFLSVETAQIFFIATFGWDQLIDAIMSIMLLAIFINKLFTITIDTIDYESMNQRNIQRQRNSILLNESQMKYLKIVTKQFILSTYAILSTQAYIFWNSFSGIVYSNLVWTFGDDINYGLYVICVILFCNDCISNAIAIYLNFSFNDKLYFSACKSCDKCCGNCCQRLAKNKAKKQMTESGHYVELVDETRSYI